MWKLLQRVLNLVEKNTILEWVLFIKTWPEILDSMFLVKQLKIFLIVILIDWNLDSVATYSKWIQNAKSSWYIVETGI